MINMFIYMLIMIFCGVKMSKCLKDFIGKIYVINNKNIIGMINKICIIDQLKIRLNLLNYFNIVFT